MEEYIRESTMVQKSDNDKKIELIMSIIKTKKELDIANKNFELAEIGLIDYYIYQIKANKIKLDFLINKAKKLGIPLELIETIHSRKNEEI